MREQFTEKNQGKPELELKKFPNIRYIRRIMSVAAKMTILIH